MFIEINGRRKSPLGFDIWRFDDLHELDVRSADRRLWQAVVATDDLDGPERPDGILGMVLRVRSYLFSGVLFLLVSVTSMVAHAQQSLQHTWPWWVLGISLGTGILVLYGVFEKKREQFRELSDQLRRWQP